MGKFLEKFITSNIMIEVDGVQSGNYLPHLEVNKEVLEIKTKYMNLISIKKNNVNTKPHSIHFTTIRLQNDSKPKNAVINKTMKKIRFNDQVTVRKIPNNNVPTQLECKNQIYKIKNLTLTVKKINSIIRKAQYYKTMIHEKKNIIFQYQTLENMQLDLKAMGLQNPNYMLNKLLVFNLGYKETEESIKEYFTKFGTVVKVVVEKNKKGICTGKATLTMGNFANSLINGTIHRLNKRILRLERIKK